MISLHTWEINIWKTGKGLGKPEKIDIELLHLTQGGRDLINTEKIHKLAHFFRERVQCLPLSRLIKPNGLDMADDDFNNKLQTVRNVMFQWTFFTQQSGNKLFPTHKKLWDFLPGCN